MLVTKIIKSSHTLSHTHKLNGNILSQGFLNCRFFIIWTSVSFTSIFFHKTPHIKRNFQPNKKERKFNEKKNFFLHSRLTSPMAYFFDSSNAFQKTGSYNRIYRKCLSPLASEFNSFCWVSIFDVTSIRVLSWCISCIFILLYALMLFDDETEGSNEITDQGKRKFLMY